MAIVNCDGKAIEWYAGSDLSGCPVAKKEIIDGIDQHTMNQQDFDLPSRLIAKKFIFRLIYGGTEYSYANDPDFTNVSKNPKYWLKVIQKFHDKYHGWSYWWGKLMQEAVETGRIINPKTGRSYLYQRNSRGEWPETTIKNYIIQGYAADIMSVARVSFSNRFKKEGIDGLQVNTVHDSIVVDVADHEVERVARMFHSVFDDLPKNFERVFKVPFNLPLRCEVSVGKNMKELEEINLDG